jgi:formylmethanofuran dehydrogenase subunit E
MFDDDDDDDGDFRFDTEDGECDQCGSPVAKGSKEHFGGAALCQDCAESSFDW